MTTNLRPLSRDEVRGIDARAAEVFGMPTLILMENAGRGAAALLRERVGAVETLPRVLVVCGPGNNGGDGAVVARYLDLWEFTVRVLWLVSPESLRGDAASQWTILDRSGFDQSSLTEAREIEAEIAKAGWIVDGLFGTGLTRPVEGLMLGVIGAMNRSGKPVLALDLPSGLDADRGVPLGEAVRAALTATFVAPKLGFAAPGASGYTGEVEVIEIGAPRRLLEPFRASAGGG